jgi:hypothetical protein
MSILMTLLVAFVVLVAGTALAYPRKVVLTQGGWTCIRRSDDTVFVMSFTLDDHYSRGQPLGGNGNYRYNRDAGKINFRSGPMEEFFGKLSQGLSGWDMSIKRDSNGRRWGSCSNYTAGF